MTNYQHATNRVATNGIVSNGRETSRSPVPRRKETTAIPAFSLRDTAISDPHIEQAVPTLAIGVGTTGCDVVHRVFQRLPKRPVGADYLLIDAMAHPSKFDPDHTYLTHGAVSGAGTVAAEGQKLFTHGPTYEALRGNLRQRLADLRNDDPILPCRVSPSQATDVLIVAGSGGTGGGGQDVVVQVVRDAAADRKIEVLRVYVLVIGPEVAIRDLSRKVYRDQARSIRGTAAALLFQYAHNLVSGDVVTERRPDGTAFASRGADRVWMVAFADRSNGYATCPRSDDLTDVLADALFFQLFTPAGPHIAAREIDFVGTKSDGRATRGDR